MVRRFLILLPVVAVVGFVLFALSCSVDDRALRHSV